MILKASINILAAELKTNRQTSINITTDWPALPNWWTQAPHPVLATLVTTLSPLSDVSTGLRKKFSCPAASLGEGRAPPTGPTDGSDDLQPAEGRGIIFYNFRQICSVSWAPSILARGGSSEQTRYQDISSKFVSTPHTCGQGGGLYTIDWTNRCDEENFWVLKKCTVIPIIRAIDFFIARVLKLLHVS